MNPPVNTALFEVSRRPTLCVDKFDEPKAKYYGCDTRIRQLDTIFPRHDNCRTSIVDTLRLVFPQDNRENKHVFANPLAESPTSLATWIHADRVTGRDRHYCRFDCTPSSVGRKGRCPQHPAMRQSHLAAITLAVLVLCWQTELFVRSVKTSTSTSGVRSVLAQVAKSSVTSNPTASAGCVYMNLRRIGC